MKKTLVSIVDEHLQSKAEEICKKICKYNEEFQRELKETGDVDKTYNKHCSKCPIIDWYTH